MMEHQAGESEQILKDCWSTLSTLAVDCIPAVREVASDIKGYVSDEVVAIRTFRTKEAQRF